MYHEGAPEFVDHQGLYYPPASNCGYYCTGFELPVEWEDHQNIFSVDGPEIQHAGAHTESLPYVYYTPSYGYTQPTYNPYNPYIPGAMMGDGTLVGAQQYYSITPYQNLASSPAIVPIVVQPDIIANSSPDPLLDPNSPITNRSDGRGLRQNLNHASIAYSRKPQKSALDQASSLTRVSDRPSKQTLIHGSVSSASYPSPAAMRIYQDRSASDSVQPKLFSRHNQLRVGLSTGNGLADLESSVPEAVAQSKLRPEMNVVRDMSEAGRTPDMMGDQNRGPRTNRLKTQFSVKAYTTKVGDSDSEGNITIHADQYNRDDFSLDYADAKFFVIKSYSEDDVHKSIKYNVWSSTPHGNKKLEIAYEDAQKIATELSSDCPIFLFYSVNASGQFCGVAEMVGSVNFQKDMDFWQQDKWSGSFPVKWHIIKDVPNSHLRHIILENNENKPVTNSRDTQEIMYKQGMEMLKIFKNHTMKTSLLDDFMYYENRQKIMHEEKASLLYKTLGDSLLGPLLDPGKKLQYIQRALEHEKITKESEHGSLEKTASTSSEQVSIDSDVNKVTEMSEKAGEIAAELRDVTVSTINIGSLTINPKQAGSKPSIDSAVAAGNSSSVQIVTVGSMPVKVNGTAESSGYLTVGTIQLKSRSLQPDGGASAKGGSPS